MKHTIAGLVAATVLGLAAPFAQAQGAAASQPTVEVWRSPYCGCCGEWVKHLEKSGFKVKVNMVEDASVIRRAAGIPDKLGSCHTAKVNGYALEGHVPASDIRRLLAEKPKAVGLSVPGMPQGSPGMEQGRGKDPFDTVLVKNDGTTAVFQSHR